MWRFGYYEMYLNKLLDEIPVYLQKRAKLQDSPDYSDGYKQGRITELDAEIGRTFESTFSEISGQLAKDLATAKKAATGTPVPFDERNYYATIATQDVAGKKPAELLALYQEAVKSGSKAHRDELARLIGPTLYGSDLTQDWWKARQASLSPEEARAERMEMHTEALQGMFRALQQHTGWQLDGVRNDPDFRPGETVDKAKASIQTVYSQIATDERFAVDAK